VCDVLIFGLRYVGVLRLDVGTGIELGLKVIIGSD